MKLSLILAQARAGELASVSKAAKTDETIISYVNLALIALYNRFQLATEEAIITLRPDLPKTLYTMDSSDADVKVSGQAMTDDEFMSIVAAYNEDGTEISVNSEKDELSVNTVTYNQLQIPLITNNAYVSIIYRKNPTLITYTDDGNGNAVDANVPLPLQLLEPALHYIGYRAHGAVNGNVNAENSTHYTRYLQACDRAELLGVITANDTVSSTVEEKGYM